MLCFVKIPELPQCFCASVHWEADFCAFTLIRRNAPVHVFLVRTAFMLYVSINTMPYARPCSAGSQRPERALGLLSQVRRQSSGRAEVKAEDQKEAFHCVIILPLLPALEVSRQIFSSCCGRSTYTRTVEAPLCQSNASQPVFRARSSVNQLLPANALLMWACRIGTCGEHVANSLDLT